MTADEAIEIVKSRASIRQWEGQGPYPDEVLVAEIKRLRAALRVAAGESAETTPNRAEDGPG